MYKRLEKFSDQSTFVLIISAMSLTKFVFVVVIASLAAVNAEGLYRYNFLNFQLILHEIYSRANFR